MQLLWELFFTFFKIGLFSFGGGYAMVSIIQQEVVSKNWMLAAQYAKIVTVSQMTPGPIAVNVATYVGSTVYGNSIFDSILGAFFATLGVALPSFIIMLIIATSLEKFKESQAIKWILAGIRPAIIGVMLAAVIFFGKLAFLQSGVENIGLTDLPNIFHIISPIGILIGITAFILHYRFSFGPIKIILLTGIAGFALF